MEGQGVYSPKEQYKQMFIEAIGKRPNSMVMWRIRWHMGAYTGQQDWDTLSKVYDSCPEALCVHMADMIATHIMEVEK